MDKKLVEKLKTQLLEEKEDLEKALDNIADKDSQIQGNYEARYPEIGSEEEENAKETEIYEESIAEEHILEDDLKDVNDALQRIKKEEYGNCLRCGNPISIKRLEISPAARLCLDCQKKIG